MTTRVFVATMIVAGGCQSRQSDSTYQASLASSGKSGKEQTQAPHPSDLAQQRYEPEAAHAPLPLPPAAAIHPMDMMTSIGTGPIEVTVVPRGTTVDDTFLRALKDRISLATWPEMSPVPFDVRISNETSPAQLDNGAQIMPRAILRVEPSKSLDDRWYAVSLNAPDLVEVGTVQGQTKLANGAIGCRFRTGSEPALWGVRFAGKGPGDIVVMVDFTERVSSAILRQVSIGQANSPGSICELMEPTVAQAIDFPTAKSVTFLCRNVAPTAPMVVRFPAGMADRQVGAGGSLSLKTTDFRGRADGQFEWRPAN